MAQSGGVPTAQYRGVEQTRPLENPALAAAVSGPRTQGAICCSLMQQASVFACVCMLCPLDVCCSIYARRSVSVSLCLSVSCMTEYGSSRTSQPASQPLLASTETDGRYAERYIDWD